MNSPDKTKIMKNSIGNQHSIQLLFNHAFWPDFSCFLGYVIYLFLDKVQDDNFKNGKSFR